MSEDLAPLSLFSEKVQTMEKNEIRLKLINMENQEMPPRLINSNQTNHIAYTNGVNNSNHDWSRLRIVDLIGERSMFLFHALGINCDFLEVDAIQWSKRKDYNSIRKVIHEALICINECTFRQNIILPRPA